MSAPADAGPQAAGGVELVLYTRPGCHLCDEARERIAALAAGGHELRLREVDIDSDDALHAAYLERIPVVEADGRVVSELELDADALLGALRPARG